MTKEPFGQAKRISADFKLYAIRSFVEARVEGDTDSVTLRDPNDPAHEWQVPRDALTSSTR